MSTKSSIKAEIATVQDLLRRTPEDMLLDRMSLEDRLEALRNALAKAQTERARPGVNIFFDGAPVIGSTGIEVGFAGRILQFYADAIQAKAADLRGQLRPVGQIPMRSQHALFFTHKKAGSFGFALEAAQPDLDEDDAASLVDAIDAVTNIVKGSLAGDRELAVAAHNTKHRVLLSVKRFMKQCSSAQATFRIGSGPKAVRPQSVTHVVEAAHRLEGVKTERTIDLVGTLTGVTAGKRSFEITLDQEEAKGIDASGDSTISRSKEHFIRGGLDRGIDADRVRALADMLFSKCRATLRVSEVRSARSYKLLNIAPIEEA